MNEDIELCTFQTDDSTQNDIQEYHEIKQDTTLDDIETSFSSKQSPKLVNEYDFFTKQDNKTDRKKNKKKATKKDKQTNLMDMISSELEASTVPIVENVVTRILNVKEQHESYLRNVYSVPRITKKTRYLFNDAERRYGNREQVVNLSPIFPRVLENVNREDYSIPVQYVEPVMFDDIISQNVNTEQAVQTKFLDIVMKNMKFKHHHYFTLEKLLSMKLEESYQVYTNLRRALDEISKDIKINRQTKDNLKKDLLKVSPGKKDSISLDQTVRKYTENVIQLKEKLKNSLQKKKEITHKIISLWSDIETVREKHGLVQTPFILQTTQKVLDKIEFHKEWTETFNTEYSDRLDAIEYEYITEYIKYKEEKTENKSGSGKKLAKPKLSIDEDAIKEEIEEIVNNIVTKEQIELSLKKDDSILTGSGRSGQSLIKNNYNFAMYIDDVFVCESEVYSNDNMFRVEFTESFSVQILPKNNNIKFFLLENGKNVSYIEIKISDIRTINLNTAFITQTFVYNEIIEPNSKYVGSGYSIKEIAGINKLRLKCSHVFKEKLYTTCEIDIKVGWSNRLEENQSETIKSSMGIGRQIKRLLHGTDKPSLNVLTDIISKVYDKDVTDESTIQTLSKLTKLEIVDSNNFDVDQNNPELVRLKLLHLRNIGGFGNVDKKLVPIHASQISTEQLECLQKTSETGFNMDYLNDREMEMDPIELQRFIGTKYVQKLNRNMLKNLNEYLLQKTHKDVVRDFNISWRSIFTEKSQLATLSSISDINKQQLLKQSLNKDQEIHVTVLRAFNLLDRTSTIVEDPEDDGDKIAGFKIRPLRPFVRIHYKGVSTQTVTAIGCHPSWNHTLKIKTKLEPLSAVHINIFDEYKANIAEGYAEDDASTKTVHYRYYNRWLGTLHVPLHTILSLGTIRGTFKITTPPLVFGYETLQTKESTSLIPEITQLMRKDTSFITLEITTSLSHLGGLNAYNQPLPSSIQDDYLIKHLNNFVTDYTNEFPLRNISLTFIDSTGRNKCVTQYLQPIPLPDRRYWPKNQRCESAVSKSSGRSKSSSSSGRKRDVDVERGSQEERESVFSAHQEADGVASLMNVCLRYVSLIPSYDVTETHVVTLLGLELLKVLHGSPLDHTILLASYFIYLGIKCWIAIGLGLPRGPSSYVLTKYDMTLRRVGLENDKLFRSRGFLNKNDGYMWWVFDAVNGERYELRDVGCPLKTVDYVFDNENIWVNMQTSQSCESMSFDFTKSSEWQPVFDKTVFVMKQPVVTDQALYSPPPNVEQLRTALEAKIKSKVQKWRPHMKTIWNRYCSNLLRETLAQWEYWAFKQTGPKPGFSQKLKQLMVTYKVFGFPLNMAFLNTKAVVSAVKSTGVHVSDDPKVEFGLGVEVYAYPNNVISVWVFLATISRL